jgi:hypothetical protein
VHCFGSDRVGGESRQVLRVHPWVNFSECGLVPVVSRLSIVSVVATVCDVEWGGVKSEACKQRACEGGE